MFVTVIKIQDGNKNWQLLEMYYLFQLLQLF